MYRIHRVHKVLFFMRQVWEQTWWPCPPQQRLILRAPSSRDPNILKLENLLGLPYRWPRSHHLGHLSNAINPSLFQRHWRHYIFGLLAVIKLAFLIQISNHPFHILKFFSVQNHCGWHFTRPHILFLYLLEILTLFVLKILPGRWQNWRQRSPFIRRAL